jgi:hypothetical protein
LSKENKAKGRPESDKKNREGWNGHSQNEKKDAYSDTTERRVQTHSE